MLEAILRSNPRSDFMYVVDTRPKVSPFVLSRNGLRKYKSYATMLYVQVGFIIHAACCQLDVLTAKALKTS